MTIRDTVRIHKCRLQDRWRLRTHAPRDSSRETVVTIPEAHRVSEFISL